MAENIEQYAFFYGRGHPKEEIKEKIRSFPGINIKSEVDADVCFFLFSYEGMLSASEMGLSEEWKIMKKARIY